MEIMDGTCTNNAEALFLAIPNPTAFNETTRDITCRSQCGFPRSENSKGKITGNEDSNHDKQPR